LPDDSTGFQEVKRTICLNVAFPSDKNTLQTYYPVYAGCYAGSGMLVSATEMTLNKLLKGSLPTLALKDEMKEGTP